MSGAVDDETRWGGMLQIQLVALAEKRVGTVCAACRNWRELAAFGPPYWRPRSVAELRRKAAAMSGL